jgi:hypothetical protein
MGKVLSTTRTRTGEVPPPLRKAQLVVRASTDFIGVMVVLSIVFPVTNRTDLVPTSHVKSEETAARAWIRLISLGAVNAHELHPDTVTSVLAGLKAPTTTISLRVKRRAVVESRRCCSTV